MPFTKNIHAAKFHWFLNLLATIIIFGNAEAGRLLGIQWLPLKFSAVWPATGFSLAFLLLFGFRTWPGVFLGNFAYNGLHLFLASNTLLGPLIAAFAISTGSLLQALIGRKIVKAYSSPHHFQSVKDVVIFLFFGGIITCMIASSVGVLTLYLYGVLPEEHMLFTWMTFWIGDTMGIYFFTPLILVWCLEKVEIGLRVYGYEPLWMVAIFLGISYFTVRGEPLGYLFIPYNIWITYRFGLHGATIMMLFIAFVTIIPITLGNGPILEYFEEDVLLIIVSLLEILAVTSLIVGALVTERNAAWRQLNAHHIELKE